MTAHTKPRVVLTPEERDRLCGDALSGMPRKELAAKYNVSMSAVQSMLNRARAMPAAARDSRRSAAVVEVRKRLRDVLGAQPPAPAVEIAITSLTSEQAERVLALLGRVAVKHPKVFAALRIMEQLAAHPAVLLDVV